MSGPKPITTVRVTASLLASRVRLTSRFLGKDEIHYVGILSRQAWKSSGKRVWGPIGGAATTAAVPTFASLTGAYGVTAWNGAGDDLRLSVPFCHLDAVLSALEGEIRQNGEADFRRELFEELTGKELARLSSLPILPTEVVAKLGVRYLCTVRQPKNGGFVGSQREGKDVPTRRLLFLYELQMSRKHFGLMMRSPLIREFHPADLPSADAAPAEPILLEDGTERRGHLLRIDPSSAS